VRAPQLHGPFCSDEFCLFIGTTFHPKKKSQWVPRVVVFERELRPPAATTVTAVDHVFTCSPICDLTCHNIDRATGRVDLSPPQPGRGDPDSDSGVAADGDGRVRRYLLTFGMSEPEVQGSPWTWVQEWSISPHTGRVVKVYEDDGGPCDDDDAG
jgi:hypothetical protein